MVELTIRRADGSWWVQGLPDAPDCGPYDTQKDANDDRRGLERFYNVEAADIPDGPKQTMQLELF